MDEMTTALRLLLNLDPELMAIIFRSLYVSVSALLLASLLALPVGAGLALYHFPGRRLLTILLSSLMGLPPVVAGLLIYLILSNSGPLGFLQLLYTPTAMIIVQMLLIFPIVASLTRKTVEEMWLVYQEQLRSFQLGKIQALITLLVECRFNLATILLAGFGRASAEVGAVMIVGGNIANHTRVMTTAIALESSKGNLSLALGLGIVLLLMSLVINCLLIFLEEHINKSQAATQ